VKVRWLDEAVTDLKALRTYIAHDNPAAAAEVAQRIREAVRILADDPAAGRLGRVPHTREFVVSGTPYILPYRVRGNAVEVLRVLHAAQKWPDR
jgi:toxin ParE1/3/4